MDHSVKEQISNGLRLGGGLAVFLLAMVPLVDGLRRVIWAARPDQYVLWRPIGWIELILAAALLFFSAPIWTQWVLGCMLFATVKSLFILMAGTPNPRGETIGLLVIVLFTVVLLV